MPMPARISLPRTIRLVALAALLVTLSPTPTFASTDITPGQSATVSGTGGDGIHLRTKPDTAAKVVGSVEEGDIVSVLEGPIWDAEGIAWYKVVANGTRAYMSADYLSVESNGSGSVLGTVSGSATITNTGGDPINCRSGAGSTYSVVTTFQEGDAVDLTGEPVGAWQPVNCGGAVGYVHTDYLSTSGSQSNQTVATIVNTGGDPINCRARANSTATVLTQFFAGDSVTLSGDLVNTWQPVLCAGTTGYVKKTYLSTYATDDSDSTNGDSGSTDVNSATGTATISGTNGDGVNCRSARSTKASVWSVLSEGATVTLRGDSDGTWVPVVCAKHNGYVSAQFVGGDAAPIDNGNATGFSAGDNVVVANTGGQGVRLRSKASSTSSIIVVLPEGTAAVVRTGSSGDWVAVTYRTTNGFIHKDYLAAASVATPTPSPTPAPGLSANDHAEVTDLVNFRGSASMTGTVISSVEEGTIVLITGAKTNGYYPVSVAGFAGFIHGDYLKYSTKALSTGADGDSVGGETPGNGSLTPQGKKMITYAMKYLGYPYVWATHGPDTFDCSGFTYWVTLHTLKQDIGAGTWSQSIAGTPVAYSDLRPGDLVFFQNTYTWGLSHVGIYIGNGQFIHDQNEDTGVVVSSLTSTYYATRWYSARRITTD